MAKQKERYLLGTDRLADVLAGIQFIGTYRKYKVSISDWEERIKTEPLSAKTWEEVFKEHHEFFRVSDNEVCLILRRGRPSNYHHKRLETLTRAEKDALSDTDRKKFVTRKPLGVDEVGILMNTAIEMHARAISQRENNRRFWTILVPILAAILALFGTILAALIRAGILEL